MMAVDHLLDEWDGATLTDIAESLEMDRGQAHRLLRGLIEAEWLQQQGAGDIYRLNYPKLLRMVSRVLGNIELRSTAMPHLKWLAEETRNSVGLLEWIDPQLYLIERVPGPEEVAVVLQIGDDVSMDTAGGRAVRTALKAPDPSALRQPHQSGDADEWIVVTDRGEYRPGIQTIASPIFDLSGRVVGAIGAMDLVASDPDGGQIDHREKAVKQSARLVSGDLGWTA